MAVLCIWMRLSDCVFSCWAQLSIDKPGHALGLLASMPVTGDSELGQADNEPLLSFTCGSFITMTK